MNKYLLICLLLVGSSLLSLQAQTLAFPTAEGFGAYASGGRGGKIVAVTNLEDDDLNPSEGSFRWALQQYPGEPITIVFKVSGVINLAPYQSKSRKGELKCKRSNFTIAGQTAPGDGICIKGNKVNFGGSTNFIIRHMRFRIGIMLDGDGNAHADGNGSIGIENASDFIIDHCTFGWSGEENMTVYDNHRTTVQWCLVHEGLYSSGHNKGARSYASQWGGSSATYHHNLLAHNYSRSPRFNGARSNDKNVIIDFVNNVNYNWGKKNACYGGDIDNNGLTHRCNMVNNYYKPGPARPASSSSFFVQSSYGGVPGRTAIWWMSGNIMEGNPSMTADNYLGLDKSLYPAEYQNDMQATEPFEITHPVKTQTAEDAYQSVLAGVGALPRDAVDARIIDEVRTGTAAGSGVLGMNKGIIDDPNAVGGYPVYNSIAAPIDSDGDGMPDEWELANGLDPNDATDGNKVTVSGYTALEVYLNSLVGEEIALDFTSIKNEYQTYTLQASIKNNILHLKTDGDIESVSLINTLGQTCIVDHSKSSTIDVSSYSAGIYIVRAKFSNNEEVVVKTVK